MPSKQSSLTLLAACNTGTRSRCGKQNQNGRGRYSIQKLPSLKFKVHSIIVKGCKHSKEKGILFYLTASFSNLFDQTLSLYKQINGNTLLYQGSTVHSLETMLDDAIFSFKNSKFFIFQNFYLFIYCLLPRVFEAVSKLSLVVMSRPCSRGLLTAVASLFMEHGLRTQWTSIVEARRLGCTMIRGPFPD